MKKIILLLIVMFSFTLGQTCPDGTGFDDDNFCVEDTLTANRIEVIGGTPGVGKVLTDDGAGTGMAVWATSGAGFTDPMTTRGDIIYRNPSNITARLGLGANTFVLTSDGTDLSWTASAGGGNVSTSGTPVLNDYAKFVNATDIEGRNYSEVKTDLGLVIGTNVQAWDADLDTWAGVTPSANGQSLVSSANYASMRGLLGGTTIGQNIFIKTNPGAITFGRANADNTFDWLSAANFRTAIGVDAAGTDNSTDVTLGTANGLSLSTQQLSMALSNGSVTGTLNSTNWNTFNNKVDIGDAITIFDGTAWRGLYLNATGDVTEFVLGANGTFLESNGASSAPAYRSLVSGDIPDISGTYQPLDAALTNISTLTYVSPSFIKLTADDTYAVRTISETKQDLNLDNLTNDAQLKIASNLSDVAVQQTALDNITDVSGATNEYVLTKDTGTGNAIWKVSAAGGANTALSNLASVAINQPLLLGTSDAFALGSATKMWSDLFLASGGIIDFNNGDMLITHSSNLLTVGGGNLALNDQLIINQSADIKGIIIHGFDDKSGVNVRYHINAQGDAIAVATDDWILSGQSVVVKLGDADGVEEFQIRDSDNIPVVIIDSDGNTHFEGNNITGIGSAGFTQELDNGSKTTNFSIDFGTDQKQKVTLTANTMTLTLDTTFDRVGNYLLKIVNGGLATLTWASETGSVYFPGGTDPSLTASGTDIATFYYDGTDWYSVASLDFQ